jgi:Tol biopolymer transport system component
VPSNNGRYVAFQSLATNVAGGGVAMDVFLRDMWTGENRLVSRGMGGSANGYSGQVGMTSNGRFITFASSASNLVPGDTNADFDVFVWNALTNGLQRVSLSSAGGDSHSPSISDDGRYVAFVSESADLVPGDTNGRQDVFVRDLVRRTTTRVSIGPGGAQANGDSSAPSISGNGRRIAFVSQASNLVSSDSNNTEDVFVHDLDAGNTSRVSVSNKGRQSSQGSWAPSISANGRRVAFESMAPNLVKRDTNGVRDVFVRDLVGKTTRRVSVTSSEKQRPFESNDPSISSDGRYVAFSSSSPFVRSEPNGVRDVFVRDLSAGRTRRVNVAQGSVQANRSCGGVSISRNGKRVVFHSTVSRLVTGDKNKRTDVFLSSFGKRRYSRLTGTSASGVSALASSSARRTSSVVVIANRSNWQEALCAASLAGALDAPLILTRASSLPRSLKNEIKRLGATRVYVVGPKRSVSSKAARQASKAASGGKVYRVAGSNLYETSAAVASKVAKLRGADFDGKVLVVSSAAPNAAIAAVPVAAAKGRPFVLVNPKTSRYRLPRGTKRATILGTSSQVSSKVERRLVRKLGKKRVRRIGRSDKYSMSAVVSKWAVKEARLAWDGVTIVNLSKRGEAIAGGVMAGRTGTVVVAVPHASLPAATRSRLKANHGRINRVRVIGSKKSINTSTVSAIKRALGG